MFLNFRRLILIRCFVFLVIWLGKVQDSLLLPLLLLILVLRARHSPHIGQHALLTLLHVIERGELLDHVDDVLVQAHLLLIRQFVVAFALGALDRAFGVGVVVGAWFHAFFVGLGVLFVRLF